MGKFDKYEDRPALPGSQKGVAVRRPLSEELSRIDAQAQKTAAAGGPESAHRTPTVAIAFDATGSMHSLIQSAKDAIGEIMRRAADQLGRPLEIELFAYRDYDVPEQLLERSGKSTEHSKLVAWLAKIEALGGGGNSGEAVEAALSEVLRDGNFACVLLAGDEPPNSAAFIRRSGRQSTPDAKQLAKLLGEQRIPVHSFVVEDDPRTVRDFASLSLLSGGKSGRLDGTREMIDLAVLAILASIKGASAASKYAQTLQLTPNTTAFVQALLEAPAHE
jgi:hypothetical protein